jgi:16S rRNA (guanine1207-N2)-methyltransferase
MEKKRAGDGFVPDNGDETESEAGAMEEMEVEGDFMEDNEEQPPKTKKVEHYFSKRPTSEKNYGLVIAPLRGREYTFLTCSGVFSPTRVDLGTWLLVDSMQVNPNSKVLDIGCGYGVLGIVAASLAPGGSVTMVDVNERAVEFARKNVRRNGVLNAKVKRGDLYFPVSGEKFDVILSNPPFSAGMDVVFGIVSGGREHLNPGGSIQVVARHSKGGRRVEEKMREVYGNCETTGRRSGFRVYLSRLE